jgi:hypothetical protein
MFNLNNVLGQVKDFEVKDGNKIYKYKFPTQKQAMLLAKMDNENNVDEQVVIDILLSNSKTKKDKEFLEDLPFDIFMIVFNSYCQEWSEQMEKFPSANFNNK